MLRVRGITGKYSNKLLGPYIFIPFSGLFVLIYILGTVFLNVDNGFYNNKKKFPNPFIFLIHINECHPFGHYYLAAFTPAKKRTFHVYYKSVQNLFFPKGSETYYWIYCYCRHFYLYPVSENVISIMNQFNFKFR